MQGTSQPAISTLTAATREMWASSDFNQIARQTMSIAEDLVRAADPRPGADLLDIACGSGNVALVAARRYCIVERLDLAENLIARAAARGSRRGRRDLPGRRCAALPWRDASFDIVTSAFGIIFAPDQQRAAQEALRVCRAGGRLAIAAWRPEGFGKAFFSIHARRAPPPEGVRPRHWSGAPRRGCARFLAMV